jgi:sugar lactone lactonase YvrE
MMPAMRSMRWSLLFVPACLSKPPPPADCTDGSCLHVLADEMDATELAVSGGDVFWTIDGIGGAIRGCTADTCAPRSLAGGQSSPHAMQVNAEDVLWASGSEMRRVNRIRAGVQPVVPIDQNGAHVVQVFRHVAQQFYWSTVDSFWRCDYEPGEVCMSRTSLSDLASYTGPLTADPSDRLWVTSAQQLAAVAPLQGKPQRTFQVAGVRALIANEAYVFALQDGGTDVLAWPVVALSDAAPRRIHTGGTPRAMALDGEALYVAELAGRIVRIPVLPDLGQPEEIAVELPKLDAIALSGDRIYLIAERRLVAWLPKS